MKRKKPAQDHTTEAARVERVACEIIGYVHSPYKERFGTPRQPPVTEQTLDDRAQEATIELVPGHNFEQALKDLEGFEYIWVLAWLHLNEGWNPQVIPPRGEKVKRGLFATRAPHRPNPIGLSALKLTGIEGRTLKVRGIDLLDGTPVLDIKPYIPYSDAFRKALSGCLEGLKADEPDRFE